jgi:xylulokinase
LPSDKFIGTIAKDLADRFGFQPDCFIDAGCGDNMYGAVGTGNVVPGIVTISLGTSGTAYSYLETPFIDEEGEIAAFCDSTGHYLPLLCVSNLANGYNALIKEFDISHLEFNEIVKKVEPACNGRLIIPWFTGERTPDLPLAAPFYFGFKLEDFNKSYLCRAVLEGHVLNLYNGFKKMPVTVKEIRLTGGLSQSEAWCQTIADIFGAEVVPVAGEGAAIGAALHAFWVYYKEKKEDVPLENIVRPFVRLEEEKRKVPNHEYETQYRLLKDLFDTLTKMLRGRIAKDDPFRIRHDLIRKC